MTTPGGAPNLPQGALTIDTLASDTQDMTTSAMKTRAADRFSSIFDNSTGLSPASDITPFGILTSIFAGFNSTVANADPADVQGPEDLPGLLLQFIEGLPVIGQLVDLLAAILGTYTGDDPVLLEVQAIFAPIRAIVDALTSLAGGTGGLGQFFPDLLGMLGLGSAGLGTGSPTVPGLGSIPILGPILNLFGGATNATQAGNFWTSLLGLLGNPTGMTSGSPTLGSLGSIPILGPIFSLFGGATNATQAGNFWTSILGLLGNPTGLLTGSPTVPGLSSIPILGPLVDGIFESVLGVTRDGSNTPSVDLQTALQNIPFLNIIGIGGPANIGGSIQSTWDQLIGGLVGAVGAGSSLADLFNISNTVSSNAALGQLGWGILGIRSNKPLWGGLLPTGVSNVPLPLHTSTAPTFALTQSTATTSFHHIDESSAKGAVSWNGSGVTSITDFFVNIFQMDSAGNMTLVHSSPNIIADVSSALGTNVYTLKDGSGNPTPLNVVAGDTYGIELAVRGAGTHNVVGYQTWLPNHPTVYPRNLAATRNSGTSAPPSTIATGSVSYSQNVAVVEFAVSPGQYNNHEPQLVQFTAAGSTIITIPTWANYVDTVLIGGGGGGHQGGTLGISGKGGDNATWQISTWVRGTDYTGTPTINVTIGGGGAGGGGNGTNGAATALSITGHSVTSNGGAGATGLDILGSEHVGQSSGNITYMGRPYTGGVAQNTYGGNGSAPGGGGGGGNWISLQPGGNGASGAAWITFRQT